MENNAHEFKKLSEVETAETVNEVDTVLIVQNGEIKQTPKNNVGGAGGGIGFDLELYSPDSRTLYIKSGSVNNVIDKLDKYDFPFICVTGRTSDLTSYFKLFTEPTERYIGMVEPDMSKFHYNIREDDTGKWNVLMTVYYEGTQIAEVWAVEYNG